MVERGTSSMIGRSNLLKVRWNLNQIEPMESRNSDAHKI